MTIDIGYIAFGLLLGCLAGYLHFQSLQKVTELYLSGKSVALAIGFQLLRLALLFGMLAMLARLGALPLLAALVGILLMRTLVLRRAKSSIGGRIHG
ncbi:ATP synthase subunit I [uncultured Cohaesibacter sp.]|uniref:N-ATPase subunit AtpR n=1 Tax=uncultured Cohaesibacter sp. TaxID=1002546 RepID=UPI0029C89A68|nr:ATP synthase subunit I [uncultured Cohaesibacter sp.]